MFTAFHPPRGSHTSIQIYSKPILAPAHELSIYGLYTHDTWYREFQLNSGSRRMDGAGTQLMSGAAAQKGCSNVMTA